MHCVLASAPRGIKFWRYSRTKIRLCAPEVERPALAPTPCENSCYGFDLDRIPQLCTSSVALHEVGLTGVKASGLVDASDQLSLTCCIGSRKYSRMARMVDAAVANDGADTVSGCARTLRALENYTHNVFAASVSVRAVVEGKRLPLCAHGSGSH